MAHPAGSPVVLQAVGGAAPTADVTTWEATPNADMNTFYWTGNGTFFSSVAAGRTKLTGTGSSLFKYQTSLQASWSFATRLAWLTAPHTNGAVPGAGFDSTGPGEGGASYDPYRSPSSAGAAPIAPGFFANRWRCILQPGDTIRSLLYWNANNASGSAIAGADVTTGGDLRVGQLTPAVNGAKDFREHPDYFGPASRACVLRAGDGTRYFPLGSQARTLAGSTTSQEATLGNHIKLPGSNQFQDTRAFANLPWSGGASPRVMVNGVVRAKDGQPGDFDNGMGDFADGPFLNKQDEGNVIYSYVDDDNQTIYPVPYFTHTWSYEKPGNTFTSPSRQMPSAAMFGSLPSQVQKGYSWQTLALCPNTPDKQGKTHPGNVDPKDHYLLDLFMTPVVEPYPISEPFSTAGKVNLNYRIAPFDYIRRSTALRGAFYPIRVTAVPSAYYLTYKTGTNNQTFPDGSNYPLTANFRFPLDRDTTIQSFDGLYDAAIASSDPNSLDSSSPPRKSVSAGFTPSARPTPNV